MVSAVEHLADRLFDSNWKLDVLPPTVGYCTSSDWDFGMVVCVSGACARCLQQPRRGLIFVFIGWIVTLNVATGMEELFDLSPVNRSAV